MYSMMGKRKMMDDPLFICHERYYQQAGYLADLLIVENVPQYKPELVRQKLGNAWTVKHCIIDPRLFGLPAARSRIFLLCYKHKRVTWRKEVSLETVLSALTSQVTADASMYLWRKLPPSALSKAKDTHGAGETRVLTWLCRAMLDGSARDFNQKNMIVPCHDYSLRSATSWSMRKTLDTKTRDFLTWIKWLAMDVDVLRLLMVPCKPWPATQPVSTARTVTIPYCKETCGDEDVYRRNWTHYPANPLHAYRSLTLLNWLAGHELFFLYHCHVWMTWNNQWLPGEVQIPVSFGDDEFAGVTCYNPTCSNCYGSEAEIWRCSRV